MHKNNTNDNYVITNTRNNDLFINKQLPKHSVYRQYTHVRKKKKAERRKKLKVIEYLNLVTNQYGYF